MNNINEIIENILYLEEQNVKFINEYSIKYQGNSVDYIFERLNENKDFVNISNQSKELREKLGDYLITNKIYLTGKNTDNGFLVDTSRVVKDNTYVVYAYTALDEISDKLTCIAVDYNSFREYIISDKRIKRVILNKNTVNLVIGKSNFIRGNMNGLLMRNKLELD